MTYYLNLFSMETWAAAKAKDFSLSGFRERQRTVAKRIQPGDIFLCYIVGLSRWGGALEITSTSYEDAAPVYSDPDPFIIRFKTKPIYTFEIEHAVPIFEDSLWSKLSMTRDIPKGATGWATGFRGSLREISRDDGDLVLAHLKQQAVEQKAFDLTERDKRQLARRATPMPTSEGDVVVEVPPPENEEPEDVTPETATGAPEEPDLRESLHFQGLLAKVGVALGFKIWIAPGDRKRVAAIDGVDPASLLDRLPFKYHDSVMGTIQQIDVIWLNGRTIVRAFEVEHTTAIYSGLLRMADLVALQPNLDLKLHIVASVDKREKVLRELRRPVFALLENGVMQKRCSYLSYDALREISELKMLSMMKDGVVDQYEEHADDVA